MYVEVNKISQENDSYSLFKSIADDEIEDECDKVYEKIYRDNNEFGLFLHEDQNIKQLYENSKMGIEIDCKCLDLWIECSYCKGKFYMGILNKHMEKCLFKTHSSDLENKENINSDKNSILKCEDCSNYVLMNDYEEHLKHCCKKQFSLDKNPSSLNQRIKLEEERNLIRQSSINRMCDYEEEHECPLCLTKIRASVLEDHIEKCLLKEQEAALTKKFVCQSCFSSILISEKQIHLETCSEIKKIKAILQSMEEQIFPVEWGKNQISCEQKSSFLCLCKLTENCTEYTFVSQKISSALRQNGLKIEQIERIENKTLWRKYFEYMELIKSQKLNSGEGWLFHGTRTNNPYIIAKDGFDISFSNDLGSLGRGIYFAKEPSYSIPSYCYVEGSYLYVFLCLVHCGNSYNSNNGRFYKPPLMDAEKGIYYDSVYNSKMVVVYENYKAYPYYLIKLKKGYL